MTTRIQDIEKDLWAAADELRANSKLSSQEYSVPVLGLIFLRYRVSLLTGLILSYYMFSEFPGINGFFTVLRESFIILDLFRSKIIIS